jgi:hypothetical protein
MSFQFDFSSSAAPFSLSVGPFGGTGFVELVLDSNGIRSFSSSLQFGAVYGIDLGDGLVRGEAFIFGGLFYFCQRQGSTNSITYSAFIHAGGSGTLLGFISVSIDFYCGLKVDVRDGHSVLTGGVEITYRVKIAFFSQSFTIRYEKVLQGSPMMTAPAIRAEAPTFIDHLSQADWLKFRSTFARN